MQRKKPTAKQLKDEQAILDNPPHREFGGCLPDPPEDCTAHRSFIGQDGTEYVNLPICASCKKECARYHEHQKAMKEWREQASEIIQQRRIRKGKEG